MSESNSSFVIGGGASKKKHSYRRSATVMLLVSALLVAVFLGGVPREEALASSATVTPLTAISAPRVLAANTSAGSHGSQTSDWGNFKLTKTPSTYSVPNGGAEVTYTYTIQNLTTDWLLYGSLKDDKCARVRQQSGLTNDRSGNYFIPANSTATFTCTTYVSQTVTNTATALIWYPFKYQVRDRYGRPYWTSRWEDDAAQAQATVVVSGSGGGGAVTSGCELWYASMRDGGSGELGTWGPSGVPTTKHTIETSNWKYNDSSAMAVDPTHPNLIYFTKRNWLDWGANDPLDALYVYDIQTDRESKVSDGLWNYDPFATNRLAVNRDGAVWSFANDGKMYVYDPDTGSVSNPKTVQNLTQPYWIDFTNLQSGDIAFDGLGNMWILAADTSSVTYLLTISSEELKKNSGIVPTLVGKMNSPSDGGYYNGLGFSDDGRLYASSFANQSGLYEVNTVNGTAKPATQSSNIGDIADMASCALPKPELQVEKTVKAANTSIRDGFVAPDTLEYTITIKNLGNLNATGVTFEDDIPSGTTYVSGSTKLNGNSVGDVNGRGYFTQQNYVKGAMTSFDGVIPPSDTATISFKVKVPQGTTEVCNQGSVNFTGSDVIFTEDPNVPGGESASKTCITNYTPTIGVDKKGSATVLGPSGGEVTYTYYVSTNPNQAKGLVWEDATSAWVESSVQTPFKPVGNDSLKDISVTDDQCSQVTAITDANGKNIGDQNSDGYLDIRETWQYQCTQTLTATTENKVTAKGTGRYSKADVTDTDWWKVYVPTFAVKKEAQTDNGWAFIGSEKQVSPQGSVDLTYRVTVMNTGEIAAPHGEIKDSLHIPQGFELTSIAVNDKAVTSAPTSNQADFRIPASTEKIKAKESATYTVVATLKLATSATATDPDWANLGQCDVQGAGDPSKGVLNRVTLEKDSDGADNNDACIALKPAVVDITVRKEGANCDTDQSTCGLSGAEFALYSSDPASASSTPISLTKQLADASIFDARGLMYGKTYWLVETKAPDGFNLLAKPIAFTVEPPNVSEGQNARGHIVISDSPTGNAALVAVSHDDGLRLIVRDTTPANLPKSGGTFTPFVLTFLGFVLILGSAAGYRTSFRCTA